MNDAAPSDDEMDQNLLDHMIQKYRLSENLADSIRKHALSLAIRLLVSRRTHYDRKHQRQFELQKIRQEVGMIRSTNKGVHPGLAEMLNALESSIEQDFESMKTASLNDKD